MKAEEIDALLGGEAQRLADQYKSVPLDFMDGYGWALTQICRLFHDAVPVRHGKWEVTPVYIKCSECGESFMLIPQNYCPNCGARMDAERKEE